MTTSCPYCDYSYPDQPLDKEILKRLAEPDLPIEDYYLFIQQQVEALGIKEYSGVKIHIGRMHKGEIKLPFYELNDDESKILNDKR